MALGYHRKLYILAFDHRGSFQKKMFGIEGDPTAEQTETITDAKKLIFEGMEIAVERGVDAEATGVLVDEQFGGEVPKLAHEDGLVLAMPVEKSGVDEFDFEYGSDFGEPHRAVRPALLEGARPLQPGRRRRDEPAPARAPQGARRLAARQRPAVPLRAAGPGRRRPARVRRRRQRPLRRRAAPGADAPRDRGLPGVRHRGRRVEDRGRRRPRGRRDAGQAGPLGRGPRGRHVRAAGPRRVRRQGRALAPAGGAGRGLRRLRDRPLDLVGRAEGLPRRRASSARPQPSRSPTSTCASCRSTTTRRPRRASERRAGGGGLPCGAPPRAGRVVLARSSPSSRRASSVRASAASARTPGRSRSPAWRACVRVVDGDTVRVRLASGAEEPVRYIGVDTPESVTPDRPVECYGARASEFNRRLVAGRAAAARLRPRAARSLWTPARLRLPRARRPVRQRRAAAPRLRDAAARRAERGLRGASSAAWPPRRASAATGCGRACR